MFVLGVVLVWVGVSAPSQGAEPETFDRGEPVPASLAGDEVFASRDGVDLTVPNREVVLVGFHEASYDTALELFPSEELAANGVAWSTAPLVGQVLPTRGRATSRTSAVDVVVADGTPVRAPVSGVVVEVEEYWLYGQHPDVRVVVADDGESLEVVMLHLEEVKVAEGDRVSAGQTVVAGAARRFPFESQVDRFAMQPGPHVHMEVRRPQH